MNHSAIDNALELGLVSCLRSIQRTNPSMLLTTSQLKRTERNVKYIPAVSFALSSLIINCNDSCIQNRILRTIYQWDEGANEHHDENSSTEEIVINENTRGKSLKCKIPSRNQDIITKSIEMRFRNVMGYRQEYRRKKKQTKTQQRKMNKKRKTNGGSQVKINTEKDLDDFLPPNIKKIDRKCVQKKLRKDGKFTLTSQMEETECESENNIEDLRSNGLENLFSKEEFIPISPTNEEKLSFLVEKDAFENRDTKDLRSNNLDTLLSIPLSLSDEEGNSMLSSKVERNKDTENLHANELDTLLSKEGSIPVSPFDEEGLSMLNSRVGENIEDLHSNDLDTLLSKEENSPVSSVGDAHVINVKQPSTDSDEKTSDDSNFCQQFDQDQNGQITTNHGTKSSMRRNILETKAQESLIHISSFGQNKDRNRDGEDKYPTMGRFVERRTGSPNIIESRENRKYTFHDADNLEKSQASLTESSSSKKIGIGTRINVDVLDTYDVDRKDISLNSERLLESSKDSAEALETFIDISSVKERNTIVSDSLPQSIQTTEEIERFDDWW